MNLPVFFLLSVYTVRCDIVTSLPASSFRAPLDKMAALDLPAQLDPEASPVTSVSPDPRDLL